MNPGDWIMAGLVCAIFAVALVIGFYKWREDALDAKRRMASQLLRPGFAEERLTIWASAGADAEPGAYATAPVASFPSAEDWRMTVIGEAHFVRQGVVFVGLAEVDSSAMGTGPKERRLALSQSFSSATPAVIKVPPNAIKEIQAARKCLTLASEQLGSKSLGERFLAAPKDVYHFSFAEIEDVSLAKPGMADTSVATVFGTIGVLGDLSNELRQKLAEWQGLVRAWHEQHPRSGEPGKSTEHWTRQKAVLHLRNHETVCDGLVQPVLRAGAEPSGFAELCRYFSNGLNARQYFALVESLASGGEPRGAELAATAARVRRAQSRYHLAIAALLLVASPVVWLAALFLGTGGGAERNQPIVVVMGVVGLFMLALGLLLGRQAIDNFLRSGKYLRRA